MVGQKKNQAVSIQDSGNGSATSGTLSPTSQAVNENNPIQLNDVNVNAERVNPLVGNDLQSQIPVARQNELVQEVNAQDSANAAMSDKLLKIQQAYQGNQKDIRKAQSKPLDDSKIVQGVEDSDKAGNRATYLYNELLNGIGRVASGAGDLGVQFTNKIYGIENGDEVLKAYREEFAPGLREEYSNKLGGELDKGLKAKYQDETFTSALGGLANSVPAMALTAGSGGLGVGAMFLQSYDSALESINNSEAGRDLDETTKSVFAGGVGLVTSALEKYGFDKIFKGETGPISNLIARKALEQAERQTWGKVTGDVFTKFLDKEIINLSTKFAKGGAKALDGALVEYGTEALQEGAQAGAELLVNKTTGKPVFDVSETSKWDGFLARMNKAGIAGAIGGGLLGGVAGIANLSKSEVSNTEKSLDQVNTALSNENLSDASREVLVQKKIQLQDELQSHADKIDEAYNKLNENQKTLVNTLVEQKAKIQEAINDPELSDDVKKTLTDQTNDIDKQISEIKPEEKQTKSEDVFKEYDAAKEFEGITPKSDQMLSEIRDNLSEEYGVESYDDIFNRLKEESDKGKGFFAKLMGSDFQVRNAAETEFRNNILKALEQTEKASITETTSEVKDVVKEEINKLSDLAKEGKFSSEEFTKTHLDDNMTPDELARAKKEIDEDPVAFIENLKKENEASKPSIESKDVEATQVSKTEETVAKTREESVKVEKPKFTIKGETVTPKENVNTSTESKPTGEVRTDAEVVQPTKDDRGGNATEDKGTTEKVKSLDRLAHQNIESEDLNDTASNQAREKGREFTDEESQYNVQKKMDALRHGDDIVVEAKKAYGDDYVNGLLNYIDENGKTLTADKKQLMYVTLENDLNRQLLADPENLTLKKQEKLVADKSRAFGRETGRAVAMGALRQLARVGYDPTQVTEDFFSPKERVERSKIEKAVQATSEDIQKEYETQQAEKESNTVDIELERLISEGVERQIKDIYDKLPSKRKERADKAINALEKIQKKLRANTYDAGIGLPIAILDGSITIIKNSIRAGVKVADAIELGINYIKEKQGKWSKEDKFRKDMLAGFESENIDLKEGKSIMSPEQRRKIYITQLNKDIADLDAQIEAGEKKVVNKEDKYSNDEEITKLREERDTKRDELNEIDPRQREASKLKQDLDKAQKSLEEYERRIDEDDFTPAERNQQNVDAKLKDLRDKRNKVKEEYQNKKKAYEESLKDPIVPPTKEELEAKEVQRKIDANNKAISDLQDRLAKNDLSTNTKNQSLWTADLGKLEATRSRLQKELSDRRAAQAKANKPIKTVDEEINAKIESDIKASKKRIEELEEKLANNDLEVKTKKSTVWSEELGKLKQEQAKLAEELKERRNAANTPEAKNDNLLKQALIDAGYSREMTVTDKDGKKEKKSILDWRKLTGEEGSLDNINKVIDQTLGDKGYTSEEIANIKQALKDEYNDLHASIIEKATNELERRNTPRDNNSKILARRLAELYNYGLFDQQSDTYDRLVNQTLGVSINDQKLFEEIKGLHKSLADLIDSRDANGKKLSDVALSTAEAKIKNDIKKVIQKVAFSSGNGAYKATVIIKNLVNGMQRQLLNTVGQLVENPISASYNDLQIKVQDAFKKGKWDTPELQAQRRMLSKAAYKSVLLDKGEEYGGVGSPFTTKNAFDDAIRSVTPSKLYQAYVSAVTGTAFLDSSDSAFKIKRTELEFTHNLIRVLTDKSNPNGAMSQQEALKFVSESLTGQSFEDAMKTAKDIIESVNKKAGKEILSTSETNVIRMANDIVKDALLNGEKITKGLVESSFKAAYTTAGTGLGHESNNFITKGLGALNRSIEADLNDAIKRKEWGRAAWLNMYSILSKNILNPFAGGGANWTILGLQKMGLPVQWLDTNLMKNKALDLSTVQGLKDAQTALQTKASLNRANGRTLIAGTTGLIIAGAVYGSGTDDDIKKFRKKHPVLDKYLYKVVPPMLALLTDPNQKAEGRVRAIGTILGDRAGGFGDKERLYLIGKDLAKGKTQSASGRAGDMVGSRFNVPYSPISSAQMSYQVRDLYREFMGLPPIKSKFKNKQGFVKGFFKRGWWDFLGGNDKTPTNKK